MTSARYKELQARNSIHSSRPVRHEDVNDLFEEIDRLRAALRWISIAGAYDHETGPSAITAGYLREAAHKALMNDPPAAKPKAASVIEKAIGFALERHAGQVDKGGQPYIFHCLSVMMRVRREGGSEQCQVAAVLHDVLEDTSTTTQELRSLFGASVAELVRTVTRRKASRRGLTGWPDESYPEYIRRLSDNEEARLIKVADIVDNLDPARHGWAKDEIAKATLASLKRRYELALSVLTRPTTAKPETGAAQ